jgi:hypothetical protein
MRHFLFIILPLFILTEQTVLVNITDKHTGEPLVGVAVRSGDTLTYTDFDGNAVVMGDTLVVSYPSYADTVVYGGGEVGALYR